LFIIWKVFVYGRKFEVQNKRPPGPAMKTIDFITLAAIGCFLLSFFIGKNAIRITLIAGAVIAGGWALDDLTSGTSVNWTATKQILIFATLAGAGWEIVSRLSNSLHRKSAER